MPTSAIFPTASLGTGMYESFYLRAVSPVDPVGVWIRHTVHKRPGQPPKGSVWCTLFDAGRGRPFMHKLTSGQPEVPRGGWIEVDGTRLTPVAAQGSCGAARWSLHFASAEPELRHLPWGWLKRRSFSIPMEWRFGRDLALSLTRYSRISRVPTRLPSVPPLKRWFKALGYCGAKPIRLRSLHSSIMAIQLCNRFCTRSA